MGLFKPNGHEEITVLKDVCFEAEEGEFLGIIGDNGSGKSTLLKIIARILRPSQGSIEVVGRVTPFLELGVGFHPELTVRENIGVYGTIMGLSHREINDRMEEIIDFAGLQKFSNAKLKNLSSGMQVRLAFSTAVQTEPDILLVDEVLAVGDMDFQQKCFDIFNRYKREGVTVLFVSHDLGSVRRFCDRTLLLRRGEQIALGDTGEILDMYIYGGGRPAELPPPPEEPQKDASMAQAAECSEEAEVSDKVENSDVSTTPEVRTEATSEVAPEATPEETPDVKPDTGQVAAIELIKEPLETVDESIPSPSISQGDGTSDSNALTVVKTDQMDSADDNPVRLEETLPAPADMSGGMAKQAEPEGEILTVTDEIHEEIPEEIHEGTQEIPAEHQPQVSTPAADVLENKDSTIPDVAMASELVRTDTEEVHANIPSIDVPHIEAVQSPVAPEATTDETLKERGVIESQDNTPLVNITQSEAIKISEAAGYIEATPRLVDKTEHGSEPDRDVVRVLNNTPDGFKKEPNSLAASQASPTATGSGNGNMRITGVQFLDKFGAENTRFYSDDSMRIRIHYSAPSKIYDPIFGIALYSEKGYHLYGTNTDLKGVVIDSVEGEGCIDLDIERLPMLSGRFLLTVAVVARDHKPYDWIDKQFSFEVIPKGKDDGIFDIPCKWITKSNEALCTNANYGSSATDIEGIIQQFRGNVHLMTDPCINDEVDGSELWSADAENNCYFLYGWHSLERWKGIPTRWMKDNAIIGVYSKENKYAALTFKAFSFYRYRSLEVYGTDCLLKKEIAPYGFAEIHIATYLKQGLNIIWLHVPEGCDKPCNISEMDSKDDRGLSLAIQCVDLLDIGGNLSCNLEYGTFRLPEEPFKPGTSERSVEIPWAMSHYNGERKVLDVGFANAEDRYLKKLLSLRIPSLYGIDIVKKRVNGIKSVIGDLRNIPFQNNYFDLIWCISTIEHVGKDNTIYKENYRENDELADFKAIKELSRIVKTDGKIIITVPYGKFCDYGWFIQYDEGRWNKLIRESGCKVVQEDFFLYDNGWLSCSKHKLSDILYKDNNAPAAAGLACVLLKKDSL